MSHEAKNGAAIMAEAHNDVAKRAWKHYRKSQIAEMRPYIPGEDMTGISVAAVDTPEEGGMIARNPVNHEDQWYVAKKFFADNYVPA